MADWKKLKNIHIVGIGGAGCSALAGWLYDQGFNVSGCDLAYNERTKDLKKKGIKIANQHDSSHLKNIDWLIYSPAADKPGHPEVPIARRSGIKTTTHTEALGEITSKYNTIAIAGAHGKTTTTMMLSLILEKAGLDPNSFVGEGIYRSGKSNLFIIEACEYRKNFLAYHPDILIITNIAYDHPDSFATIQEVTQAFKQLTDNIQENGSLIGCIDDAETKNVLKYAKAFGVKILEYGLAKIKNYTPVKYGSKSNVKIDDSEITIELPIPGKHNVLNALAAIKAAKLLGVDPEKSAKMLKSYKTVRRRSEIINTYKGTALISDWAHHPDQISATVQALRDSYGVSKIAVIYEPHQYERTWQLFKKFTKCWKGADLIYILPIYRVEGRETEKALKSVSSEKLAKAIQASTNVKTQTLSGYKEMDAIVEKLAGKVEAIAFLNAGPLDDYIVEKYSDQKC